VIGLSVGYRIPQQIMNLANCVMAAAAPGLRAPESVRQGDADPRIISTEDVCSSVTDEARRLSEELAGGSIAIVATDERCDELSDALDRNGITHGRAAAGLGKGITVVPVSVVKGLELDGVIVVEPADIVESSDRGLRSLFVALTRSTRRLSVIHGRPLPESMISNSMSDPVAANN